MKDPIVDETRKARQAVETEAASQGKNLGQFLRERQQARGAVAVCREPRRLKVRKTA